jgi:hypothetical protein
MLEEISTTANTFEFGRIMTRRHATVMSISSTVSKANGRNMNMALIPPLPELQQIYFPSVDDMAASFLLLPLLRLLHSWSKKCEESASMAERGGYVCGAD